MCTTTQTFSQTELNDKLSTKQDSITSTTSLTLSSITASGYTAANENKFTPGKISQENSIRFTEGFFEISQDFDNVHGTNLTSLIKRDLSKYSYPILSIQRKNGFSNFISYCSRLAKRTGINKTWHYYFYSIALLIFGENICDRTIGYIKTKFGYTPQL